MDPELVDQVDARDEEHHRRRKADQEQRQAEQEGEAEEAGPGLPQRGRQIIMLARMVDDMARPEPADAVRRAVEDIIGEIVEHEGEHEPVPGIADVEEPELPHPDRQREDAARAVSAPATVLPSAQRERHQRVLRLIAASVARPGDQHLGQHQQDEGGHGIVDGIGQRHRGLLTPVSVALPVLDIDRQHAEQGHRAEQPLAGFDRHALDRLARSAAAAAAGAPRPARRGA